MTPENRARLASLRARARFEDDPLEVLVLQHDIRALKREATAEAFDARLEAENPRGVFDPFAVGAPTNSPFNPFKAVQDER